jgi:homoserine dehydrogenase
VAHRFESPRGAGKTIQPIDDIETQYYMRMTVEDTFGVLAQITRTLGDNRISLASVIQKEANESNQTAEIVLMTHPALERSVKTAITEMESLPVVKEIGNLVRVEA